MSDWVAAIIVAVVLFIGFLSVPLSFSAVGCLSTEERLVGVRIAWGWGFLVAAIDLAGRKKSFGLRLAGFAIPTLRDKPGAGGKKKANQKIRRMRIRRGFNFSVISKFVNRDLIHTLFRYLRKLIASLRLRLRLSGIYGTGDPALTGFIAGLAAAVRAEHINLDLEPDFCGTMFDVQGQATGRIVPLKILLLATALLLARPVRKAWWARLKMKSKKVK
ncbi:MAG: hypothetical protein A4E53_03236 [Pelotomaculum sp. PtaB.Bin104]|nr:MAG: hypothetical protein A4E53_03236 [Pelotomaculum sp. PtaB.Bin104]